MTYLPQTSEVWQTAEVFTAPHHTFFVAGGTLRPDDPSYLLRPADNTLFYALLAGKFCYVLTPRQMGKSSLMIRTAVKLERKGMVTAVIDLTQIGTSSQPDQWYLGLLTHLQQALGLTTNAAAWWHKHPSLSRVQRFIHFLRDVVLAEVTQPIVIFVDEIDATLALPFTDDFFEAIRAMYNGRASDGRYERLTFALLGVATPTDLIKDPNRSPFNIGQAIDLGEIVSAAADEWLAVLPGCDREAILSRIFYWTNGHPYLTQKLCLAVCQAGRGDVAVVDELVASLFLTEAAQNETNMQFVRDNVDTHPQKRPLLKLYRRIHQDSIVENDERDVHQNQLKLVGLVRTVNGRLHIRNPIYQRAFDEAWIAAMMPTNWARRLAITAIILTILMAGLIGYNLWRGQQQAEVIAAEQAITTFNENDNAVLRLNSLDVLFNEEGFTADGRSLFNDLPAAEKAALFTAATADLPDQQKNVIRYAAVTLLNDDTNNELLGVMQTAVAAHPDPDSRLLANELARWQDGRLAYNQSQYPQAIIAYNAALELSKNNPALYYDRGLAHLAQVDYELVLVDWAAVMATARDEDTAVFWQTRVTQNIINNPALHAVWWDNRGDYPSLSTIVATPTSTPTVIPSPTASSTPQASSTPTPTASHTPTRTPLPAASSTPTPTLTNTPPPLPPTAAEPPTDTPTTTAVATEIPPEAVTNHCTYTQAILVVTVLWHAVPVSGVFVHRAETNEQGIAFACAESGRSLGSIAARGPVSGIEGGWQWGGTLQVSLHKDEVNPRQIFYITMDNVYIHRINNFADNSSPDFNGDTHIFSWEPVPVPNIETYKVQVWQLRQSTNSLVWDTLAFEADLIQGTTQLVSDLPSGQCFDFWLGGYNASGQLIASQTTHGYCTSP